MTTPNEPGEAGQAKPFEPMPAAPALNEQELGPSVPVDRPKPVNSAFILWLVLGALAIVGAVLVLAVSDESLKEAARKVLDAQGKKNPTDQEIKDQITAIRTFGLIYQLLFAALILAFAFLMRGGRNWARITVLVVGGLYVILGLLGFSSPLFVLIGLVIVAAAVFFMYRPETKPFFAAGKARR